MKKFEDEEEEKELWESHLSMALAASTTNKLAGKVESIKPDYGNAYAPKKATNFIEQKPIAA